MATLYQSARDYVEPIIHAIPVEHSMNPLLPKVSRATGGIRVALDTVLENAKDAPLIQAAALIYTDDLDAAHAIVQDMDSLEAAYLHGILHRREGDFWNANYWFSRAGHLPKVLITDPRGITAEIEHAGGQNPADVVKKCQEEWVKLVNYICDRP